MHARALPAFDDNYFWTLPCSAGLVVIDPGDASVVIEHLDATRQGLHAILITHHHHDHTGGISGLAAAFPGVRVIGPREPRISGITEFVIDGDVVSLGEEVRLEVLEAPGHTRSHIAYWRDGQVFCGDTLFSLGCGRIFEGTPRQMLDSLTRIAALGDDIAIYCAHEYTLANARFAVCVDPNNVALRERVSEARALRDRGLPTLPARLCVERACNPFLRVDQPPIADAANRRAGRTLADRYEVFATLRAWKDVFV